MLSHVIKKCIASNFEESKIHKLAVNESNLVALALLETKPTQVKSQHSYLDVSIIIDTLQTCLKGSI